MRSTQDIAFGASGQELVFDAPEGRPSSVESVAVFAWLASDDDDPEDAIDGAPAVETNPNTTTDAAIDASSANRRRIPLTATTGCAGERSYLITGADQLREFVEVLDVDAGDAVIVRNTLHNAYASGATFQSTRIVAALDDAWIADENNLDASSGPSPMYRVRWVYTVAGQQYVADSYFNLVRYGLAHAVKPQDVDDIAPGWLAGLPTDHRADQGRRLIATAFRQTKLDLYARQLDDSDIADAEIIDELVALKTIVLTERAKFLAGGDNPTAHEVANGWYTARFEQLVGLAITVPVRDEDGAGAPPPPPRQLTER
jgi:hypothetical protein